MLCIACDCVYINGLKCHELGCPEAWRERKKECKWCGSKFTPEEKGQMFCGTDCARSYSGISEGL
jgi:hypothetical protein